MWDRKYTCKQIPNQRLWSVPWNKQGTGGGGGDDSLRSGAQAGLSGQWHLPQKLGVGRTNSAVPNKAQRPESPAQRANFNPSFRCPWSLSHTFKMPSVEPRAELCHFRRSVHWVGTWPQAELFFCQAADSPTPCCPHALLTLVEASWQHCRWRKGRRLHSYREATHLLSSGEPSWPKRVTATHVWRWERKLDLLWSCSNSQQGHLLYLRM